jgi:hypothetical protein
MLKRAAEPSPRKVSEEAYPEGAAAVAAALAAAAAAGAADESQTQFNGRVADVQCI